MATTLMKSEMSLHEGRVIRVNLEPGKSYGR